MSALVYVVCTRGVCRMHRLIKVGGRSKRGELGVLGGDKVREFRREDYSLLFRCVN